MDICPAAKFYLFFSTPFLGIILEGIWIGMLFGTFVQAIVLTFITYKTDWDEQVLVIWFSFSFVYSLVSLCLFLNITLDVYLLLLYAHCR